MRKLFLLFVVISITQKAAALIHTVFVTSNQFTPSNTTNVWVGDTMRFTFKGGGFHNVSSLSVNNSVPKNALQIFSGVPQSVNRVYDYIVLIPGEYLYICEVHGDGASFSGMAGKFTASSIAPLNFINFSISKSFNNNPLLQWTTQNEINISHFILKASTDGFNFTQIGLLMSSGISNSIQTYNFEDDRRKNNYKYLYYVIVSVEDDQKENYSEIKMYKNNLAKGNLIITVAPNPIRHQQQLMIQFNAENNGQLIASFFTPKGEFVSQTKMSAFAGVNNGHIHLCSFASGVYYVKFQLGNMVETRRIFVE